MDQVRMGGQIQAGLLPDLMQLLSNRSEVTGYLELLSDDGAGKIWFRNGQMVDARWGIKSGETAVELMLGIRIGRFRFIEAEYTKEPTIRRETTCILLDCMRAIDEQEPTAARSEAPLRAERGPSVALAKEGDSTQSSGNTADRPPKARRPLQPKAKKTRATRKPSPKQSTKPGKLGQLALAALLLAALALGVMWTSSAGSASKEADVVSAR